MKERPILFSGQMVRAILAGTKNQTRRVIAPQPDVTDETLQGLCPERDGMSLSERVDEAWQAGFINVPCPFGKVGERLWVRESWHQTSDRTHYRADADWPECGCAIGGWRSPIFMPQRASRLTLELADVRVEQLQEISEEDALAEGFRATQYYMWHRMPDGSIDEAMSIPARENFMCAWDALNAKRGHSWESNPWVWVLSFRKLDTPAPDQAQKEGA